MGPPFSHCCLQGLNCISDCSICYMGRTVKLCANEGLPAHRLHLTCDPCGEVAGLTKDSFILFSQCPVLLKHPRWLPLSTESSPISHPIIHNTAPHQPCFPLGSDVYPKVWPRYTGRWAAHENLLPTPRISLIPSSSDWSIPSLAVLSPSGAPQASHRVHKQTEHICLG